MRQQANPDPVRAGSAGALADSQKLASILTLCQKMNSERDLNALLDLVVAEASRLLDCERASIFLFTPARDELVSKVALGSEQTIRVRAGMGIAGAVAATGVGEEIVRRFLAKTVYDWLAEDVPPARAAARAVALFPDVVDVGILVVGRTGHAVASNRNMANAVGLG